MLTFAEGIMLVHCTVACPSRETVMLSVRLAVLRLLRSTKRLEMKSPEEPLSTKMSAGCPWMMPLSTIGVLKSPDTDSDAGVDADGFGAVEHSDGVDSEESPGLEDGQSSSRARCLKPGSGPSLAWPTLGASSDASAWPAPVEVRGPDADWAAWWLWEAVVASPADSPTRSTRGGRFPAGPPCGCWRWLASWGSWRHDG